MKQINQNQMNVARYGFAIIVTGLGFLTTGAVAQEKGAERLMKLNRPPAAAMRQPAESKTVPMSCPKCQDVVKQVPDRSAKGGQILMAGGRPTKPVVQHLCEGCSTTLSVVGHGKAKQQVAEHTCTSCGADSKSCCATTKDGKPTSGM